MFSTRRFSVFYFVLFLTICSISHPAIGQDEEAVFELTLEELLAINVSTTVRSAMGVHHTLAEDLICFGYYYGYMDMDGNRSGTQRLTPQEVLNDFMVTPTDMSTKMHMAHFMWGIKKNLTLMAMASKIEKEMDHITRSGQEFTTESSGVGDTKVHLM